MKNTQNQWYSINWKKCELELLRIQNDLVIASKKGDIEEIKKIQYKIRRMFSARALAVRKVTSSKGKKTPGVDGQTWSRSEQKFAAVLQLKDLSIYQPKPVKRVWLPKPGKTEKRPLGIPTLYDRAVQAIFLFTVEPVIETLADNRSFGFRKSRSVHDAAEYIRLMCASKYGKRYALEVDIRKFFDSINQQWLLNNIPMETPILKKMLKSGVLDQNHFTPVTSGVPQGGVLSPCLANASLDGLEKAISSIKGTFLVRYADDFVIMGDNLEQLEKVKTLVIEFLSSRGLSINEEKTKIDMVEQGFDFLGFHFREYPDKGRIVNKKKGIFLVKPTKENIKFIMGKITQVVKRFPNAEAGIIIKTLNPILRSWAEHYRSVSSRSAFKKVSEHTFRCLLRWVYRKHGNSKRRETLKKYFKTVKTKKSINRWVFTGLNERKQPITLFQIGYTTFKRHLMINLKDPKNPFLITDNAYFARRSKKLIVYSVILDKIKKKLILNQQSLCGWCKRPMYALDQIQIHHVISVKEGGTDCFKNLMALHVECHKQLTFKWNNKLKRKAGKNS